MNNWRHRWKILITGASGLLGLNLALDASRMNQVIGVDRNTLVSAPFQVIQADLLERDAVEPSPRPKPNRKP